MSEKIKRAWPHVIFKVCVFLALIVTSAYLLIFGFNTAREYHFGFKESGKIDYTVNLKDGNFLNEKSLSAGETYYSDTVSSISANYEYGADFTNEVSGDYEYYLVATVSAEKDNGAVYWTRSTQVTDAISKKLTDTKKLRIKISQVFDYLEYDRVLREFNELYDAPAVGTLKLSLVVKGVFETDIMDRKAELDSSIDLTTGLAKESIDFTVTTNAKNDGKIYTKRVNVDDDRHRYCRLSGIMLAFAVLYLVFAMCHSSAMNRKEHIYEYSVNKIREEYDSIIVDLESAPKISKLHAVRVREFDELLDVYNSIKQPINYYEAKDGAHFILINGRLAWEYVIRKHRSMHRSPKTATTRRRSTHKKK